MGKFNEYLNKKIVPIPALYKNPYFGTLKDLVSKENKGETVAKEYVKTQLDADYLNRIKNDIYEYPPYAEALEVPMLQDLKNIYLKTPQTFSSFGISKYRPKNGTQPYYFNSKILDTVGAGIVVKAGDNLKKGEVVPTDKLEDMHYGEVSHITPNNNAVAVLPGLGHATVGIGHDKKGEYISYYDNWDVGNFKPNTKHLIDFFNKSVPVYGRVYLDDYYDIPEEARGNSFITPAVVTANAKHENGGVLKAQEGTGNGFWSKLWNAVKKGGMAARDAKLGAVGAQQVRDLYSEGKNQEAQDLAKQYAKANTTGIALASGTLSSNLVSDLVLGEGLTAIDTLIDGDISNLGYNLASNISGEILGHGVGKLLNRVYPKISKEATAKIEALLKRFPEEVESVSSVSKELRDRLIKEGVDPAILTKTNLRKMVYLRGKDLLESDAPAKFAGRTNSKITSTYNLYHNTDGQIKQVGYVTTTPEDGVGKINMIENITEHTPDKVKGVSELGYNTVIKDIGASKNGTVLMQPNKTKSVLDKYPDKVIIANDGEWFNGSKYIGGNPIFQLNSPTYDVPIKYLDDFSVEGVDDSGKFLFDFTKDAFHKKGGKL